MTTYGLQILTRANSTDLVSLARVKSDLGISGSSEDTTLQTLISQVSEDFSVLCHRSFARQRYQLTVLGGKVGLGESAWWTLTDSSRSMIVLPHAPIEPDSISVTIDGDTDTEWDVWDANAGILFRDSLWTEDADIVITWYGGWVLASWLATWEVSTAYGDATVSGQATFAQPTLLSLSPYLFEATTAGTSGGTEPTWPTTEGGTVTDGTVTWTARAAEELPKGLAGLAVAAVKELREAPPRSVESERTGADATTWSRDVVDAADGVRDEMYSQLLMRALRRYRL